MMPRRQGPLPRTRLSLRYISIPSSNGLSPGKRQCRRLVGACLLTFAPRRRPGRTTAVQNAFRSQLLDNGQFLASSPLIKTIRENRPFWVRSIRGIENRRHLGIDGRRRTTMRPTIRYGDHGTGAHMADISTGGLSRRALFGAFAATAVAAAPTYTNAAGFLRGAGDVRRIRMYSARTGERINMIYWIEGDYIADAIARSISSCATGGTTRSRTSIHARSTSWPRPTTCWMLTNPTC